MLKPFLSLCLTSFLFACHNSAAKPEPAEDGSLVSEDGLRLVPIADGLEFPWGIAELPNGDLLVTEREGRLSLIRKGQSAPEPVSGLPEDILVERQGGLLDIILHPAFEETRQLYLSYSRDLGETNTTAVIRAVLSDDGRQLGQLSEIFQGAERETTFHYGSRLGFLPDGSLIITLGDGYRYMDEAQTPANLHGKIVRLNADGSLPDDNPDIEGGHPALWSYGHRNVQGLSYHAASGKLFAHEHGPKGGDELNLIEAGKNYGWPVITYGINYDGTIITPETEAPGLEQPLIKWVPSIAPSGMSVVKTPGFTDWQGDLLIGAMYGPEGVKLVRVDLDEAGEVVGTENLLSDLQMAYRDVLSTQNAIYLATADLDGVLYRLEKIE